MAIPSGKGVECIRVSSKKQDMSRQREANAAWLAMRGLETFRTFEDFGARDKSEDRADFQAMLSMVRAGNVPWIVVQARDRFGTKDPYELFHFLFELRKAGCQLWIAEEDKEITQSDAGSIFTNAVGGMTSSDEQKTKSNRSQTTRMSRASRGEYLGGVPPYALDVIAKAPDGSIKWRYVPEARKGGTVIRDGKESHAEAMPAHDRGDTLFLDPSVVCDRVATIKRIFNLFLHSAISPNRIAKMLNEEKVEPITGKHWSDARIRQLLINPIYIGLPASGKRSNAKFYEVEADGTLRDAPRLGAYKTVQGRRQSKDRWRMPAQPIFDPIIDPEAYASVVAKLDESPRRAKAPRNDSLYYAGLLVCDQCGQKMAGAMFKGSRPSYICSTKNKYGNGPLNTTGCRFHRVQPHEIDPLVERYMEQAGHDLNAILRNRGDKAALDNLLAEERGKNTTVDGLVDRMRRFIRDDARRNGVEATDQEMDDFDSDFAVAFLDEQESKIRAAMMEQGCPPEAVEQVMDATFSDMLRLANMTQMRLIYETIRGERLGAIESRVAELQSEYEETYKRWSKLKPGTMTAERAQADLEHLEIEIEKVKAEVEPLQESFDVLLDDLSNLRERIVEGRLVFAKGTDRMKAEALRGFLREIRCSFAPRAATRSDLIAIEVVPQVGDNSRVKFNLLGFSTRQATPARGTSTSTKTCGA